MLLALMAKKPPKTAVSVNGYTGTTQQMPAQQDDMSNLNKNTHTHPFNGPLSVTTQVSQYQKGKPI